MAVEKGGQSCRRSDLTRQAAEHYVLAANLLAAVSLDDILGVALALPVPEPAILLLALSGLLGLVAVNRFTRSRGAAENPR